MNTISALSICSDSLDWCYEVYSLALIQYQSAQTKREVEKAAMLMHEFEGRIASLRREFSRIQKTK